MMACFEGIGNTPNPPDMIIVWLDKMLRFTILWRLHCVFINSRTNLIYLMYLNPNYTI